MTDSRDRSTWEETRCRCSPRGEFGSTRMPASEIRGPYWHNEYHRVCLECGGYRNSETRPLTYGDYLFDRRRAAGEQGVSRRTRGRRAEA